MSLFHKPIQQVTLTDLESLMGDFPVKEGQQIDFKREMIRPESLCEAITSFANSQGGDLLIGIEEKEGSPIAIVGVSCEDTDKEKLRLLNIFHNNIEPKLTNIEIEFILIEGFNYVILIRTRRSWLRPHRVKHNSKFYARQSNGKYELDVQQLRQMFLGATEFAEKFAGFHEERVSHHIEIFGTKPFVLLQFVPVSAFENPNVVDLTGIFNYIKTIPISTSHDNRRINFIGVYSESNDKSSKLQLFRNGIIEHVTTRIIRDNIISGKRLYEKLRESFLHTMRNYKSLEIKEPVYAMLSFYGTKGLTASDIDSFYADHDVVPYEVDKMIFPEVYIEDIETVNLPEIIRPIMDALWNAYGFSKYSYELK